MRRVAYTRMPGAGRHGLAGPTMTAAAIWVSSRQTSAGLPVLYRNLGKAVFEDATRESGLAVDNRFVCWGTGLEDFDNDGWPDIPVATGHIYPELESRYPDSPYKSPSCSIATWATAI